MRKNGSSFHLLLVALLLIPIAFMQMGVDKQREKIGLNKKENLSGIKLPVEMFMAALSGFREPIAGMLWVKCDELFHTGRFEEVVPLMKVVTLLDPHMIDVYATGAWHLDYNFVDKNERSDRRLIPSALEFLEDGIRNNDSVFDLYFEMAFTHYMMKIRDPENAVVWLKRTIGKPTTEGDPTPRYVIHSLAHAYEMSGDINNCIKTWEESVAHAKAELKRLKAQPDEAKPINPLWENSPEDTAKWDLEVSTRNLERVLTNRAKREVDLAGVTRDAGFDFTLKRGKPRILKLTGTINIADYGRVDIILRDADWEERAKKDFSWRVDNQTIFQETTAVTDGKFSCDIDLTDGPRFYPLKSDKYEVLVRMNPRLQASEVQDQIGWHGEVLTGKYIKVIPGNPAKNIPPLKMLYKSVIIDKKMIADEKDISG